MAATAPVISVIIPAYNAERFLREAIDSVLRQGPFPLEIVVVDDGSSDSTPAIAASYGAPVTCLSQAQSGTAAARNAGVAQARGALVAFLDADDEWARNKLALQSALFDHDPELEAVFGHVQQFRMAPEGAVALGPVQEGLAPGTMLIRAEALRRVGPFNPAVPLAETVEWYARAQQAGLRFTMLPDVLLYRRVHEDNVGVKYRDSQRRQYFEVIRQKLQQERQQRK
jgi:glycosyltransferase involved in cell wall biosynthesis